MISDFSTHSGHIEDIADKYLDYDEDLEDKSISPEVINISNIITDLQAEETEKDLAILVAIAQQAPLQIISYSEALACLSSLISYLEALPCSSLQ